MMDGWFLIYDGFQNDAKIIFADFINRYNFEIVYLTDSGLRLKNNRCEVEIKYETGFQIWLLLPKYKVSEMIVKLSMFKGDKVFVEYQKIWEGDKREQLQKLSIFLSYYFSEEMKE